MFMATGLSDRINTRCRVDFDRTIMLPRQQGYQRFFDAVADINLEIFSS